MVAVGVGQHLGDRVAEMVAPPMWLPHDKHKYRRRQSGRVVKGWWFVGWLACHPARGLKAGRPAKPAVAASFSSPCHDLLVAVIVGPDMTSLQSGNLHSLRTLLRMQPSSGGSGAGIREQS